MTVHRCWFYRSAVLAAGTAACLAAALPAAAQAQDPKPAPVAEKPAPKAEKQSPARRGREPPRKDTEERPRPDVAVSFPADI
jgi:hypothetical protein